MNPRIGRRWNRDPVSVAWESEYAVNRNNPIQYNDPDGDCANCLAAAGGAVVGALFGAGFEIATQLYTKGKVDDWKAVGGGAAQGAITGAVAGFTGGASLAAAGLSKGAVVAVTMTSSAIANGVGGAVSKKIRGEKITAGSVAIDMSIGAIFGAGIGKYLMKKAIPTVEEIFTNSISSRKLGEKLALLTKYKNFITANTKDNPNNPIFDLIDKVKNIVDVTSTDAKTLGFKQFTKKLERLSSLPPEFKERVLQIYVKAGQYTPEQLINLKTKLNDYVKDKGLNAIVAPIEQLKK